MTYQHPHFVGCRLIVDRQRGALSGVGIVGGVDGVIVRGGFVIVAEHDAVILVLACGVAVVPMLDGGQAREHIPSHIIVADVGLQQHIRRRLIGPLDGARSPLTPGNLVRAGIGGSVGAGSKMQGHGCRGDRRPGGNGGHGGELDVRPGQARRAVADVQPIQALVLSPPRETWVGSTVY